MKPIKAPKWQTVEGAADYHRFRGDEAEEYRAPENAVGVYLDAPAGMVVREGTTFRGAKVKTRAPKAVAWLLDDGTIEPVAAPKKAGKGKGAKAAGDAD